MKGISVWIWMIAGVLIGLLLFTVFVQILGITTTTREIQIANTNFGELAADANGLCGTFGTAKISKTYTFPDIVTRIYATDASKLPSFVSGRTYGSIICMNTTKEMDCQNMDCRIEMSDINSTNQLSGTLSRILGGFQNLNFQLDVEKTDCGVSIINSGEPPGSCI